MMLAGKRQCNSFKSKSETNTCSCIFTEAVAPSQPGKRNTVERRLYAHGPVKHIRDDRGQQASADATFVN